ncbi:hypothetical protein [Candidatus Darwinibacter acetoxidans]
MRNAKSDLALCAKATPGPWMVAIDGNGNIRGVMPDPEVVHDGEIFFVHNTSRTNLENDCRFAVQARTALPYWINLAVAAENRLAKLTAELYERDLAMQNEMEALGCADDRAERLEQALEEACVLITNHVNAYGTGMDLPMDLLANSRKPEAWKKYFMLEADQ